MQHHQMNQKLDCANAQLLVRACVSAQDSQASAAATFNCRASNASSRQPVASAGNTEHNPCQAKPCTSSNPQPSQNTGGSMGQRGDSAFYKCSPGECSPADSGAAWSSGGSGGASGNSLGVVGQAMIVTSRIDGYCRAVWDLLLQCADEYDEGACLEAPEASSPAPVAPLAKFLAAVRMLVQHLILLRVQALHISAVANESDARSLLQHVLLWQHLRHNTVMELITLAMQQGAGSPPATGWGSSAAHGSFLMNAGVPLVQQAVAQVHGSLTMQTTTDGQSTSKGGALDMMAVLRMLHNCSTQAPAHSADCNIDALSQDAASLHRAVAFISSNTSVVANLLSTTHRNKNGAHMRSQQVFAVLAYTSALLGNKAHASVEYSEVPAVATARMSVARYSGTAAQLYRGAKAAILDARIQTTCDSGAPTAVARSKISNAVNKAFREMYLFPELKHLLRMWSPMLQGVVNDGLLPVDAVVGAEAAAVSAFDTQGECLRFKVPSSGFLLIWSTCPHSPAHSLLSPGSSPRGVGSCAPLASNSASQKLLEAALPTACRSGRKPSIVGLKRGPSEMLSGSPTQPLPIRAACDSVLVELGRAPQNALPTLNTSGDSGGSGSNGSDSTNLAGSGPGSDSGGSGSGGAGGQECAPKDGDSVFAVPLPRPARPVSAELPQGLSVAAQACSQGQLAQQQPVHAQRAPTMFTVAPLSAAGQISGPKTGLEAFPDSLAALAAVACIS